jgi:hypothetical protein
MDPNVAIMMMALAALQMGVAGLQIIREILALRRDAQDDERNES